MSGLGSWTPATAGDVSAGDRVRLRDVEITIARVEHGFLGDPTRLAFVKDTEERWLKVPAASDAPVEVLRGA